MENLPWSNQEIPHILLNYIHHRSRPGKALDLGCGTGTLSIFLARNGYTVTGVDFIDIALNEARRRADQAGVEITFVEADILQWQPDETYDLILDAGCLHGMWGKTRDSLKKRLVSWLANDGDYFLFHFGKKHFLDYSMVGPRRITRQKIVQWFSPELEEKEYESIRTSQPFPIGPVVSVGLYWFQKN